MAAAAGNTPRARDEAESFVETLYRLVSQNDNNHLISWSDLGRRVFINNITEFEEAYLKEDAVLGDKGEFYGLKIMDGFKRNLHAHGFIKERLHGDANKHKLCYGHPNFYKGNRGRLMLIKRGKTKLARAKEEAAVLRQNLETRNAQLVSYLNGFF